MPAPTTPVGPALASESLANSMSPGIAKAVGIGFLATQAPDAEVKMVSGDNPMPVTTVGEVETNGLTDFQLRAAPVEVLQSQRNVSSVTVTEFNKVTSEQIIVASNTFISAIIFVPDDSVAMHIRFGSLPASAASRSYTIQPGGAYIVPPEYIRGQSLHGIMSAAGNAFITIFDGA